ncbi:MAG: glutathione transferase GstA [Gammaproteobacteria bacterium]|nr:glutathione transferase GstA [Gammaproteobacteria bacterium]MBI5618033.1 glutathione transferase GstA [Gammaproteobacteria bacterium]
MKLYYCPGTCSQAVHICLREAGLKFEIEKVDIKTKQMESGRDFLTINPHGYVPVLELDDGTRLTELPAIVQYVADQAPASGLAPANGTIARYQLQGWLNFVGGELHKSYSVLFSPDASDSYKNVVRERLAKRYAVLDELLGKQAFLTGAAFTPADAYLFVASGWSKLVGVDLAPFPNVLAFRSRVAARPTVEETLKAEGLRK